MSAGYELCTTVTLMRKVGGMTMCLLDGSSVYDLIKSMMLFLPVGIEDGSLTKLRVAVDEVEIPSY